VYFLHGSAVVTGELTIRYEKPCPVERSLEIRGRVIDDKHKKYAVVESSVYDGPTLLARSSGRFFYAPLARSRT
jgi:hypothetical protein